LMVQPHDPKRRSVASVVEAEGRHRPTMNDLAGPKGLCGAVQLAFGEAFYEREYSLGEHRGSLWVALDEVAQRLDEIVCRLWRPAHPPHRFSLAAMRLRTSS